MRPRIYTDTSVPGGCEDDESTRTMLSSSREDGTPFSKSELLGRFQAMNKPSSKTSDCVQSMRQTKDRLSAEIADMSYDELAQWLRSHQYSDPFLRRLAERAAQRGEAADSVWCRR